MSGLNSDLQSEHCIEAARQELIDRSSWRARLKKTDLMECALYHSRPA